MPATLGISDQQLFLADLDIAMAIFCIVHVVTTIQNNVYYASKPTTQQKKLRRVGGIEYVYTIFSFFRGKTHCVNWFL